VVDHVGQRERGDSNAAYLTLVKMCEALRVSLSAVIKKAGQQQQLRAALLLPGRYSLARIPHGRTPTRGTRRPYYARSCSRYVRAARYLSMRASADASITGNRLRSRLSRRSASFTSQAMALAPARATKRP
jgi:hypothetical protein